jgi:[acyl-carrier-protein] S-malonyltransferase
MTLAILCSGQGHPHPDMFSLTGNAPAAEAALRHVWPKRLLLAGYSVGELSAWGVAELLDSATTLDLVALRAELMDAASSPGDGLLFVRGLSRTSIDNLCRRYSTAVAIVNPADFPYGGMGRLSAGLP